MENQTISSKN